MATCFLDESVSSLDSDTHNVLGGHLTYQNAKQRDWTGIASFVGFTCKQVDLLRQHPEPGKGWLFLKTWDGTGQSSVRKLLYALLEYKMLPCIEVLEKDKNITEDDIQTVKSEFERLNQECLKSLFSRIDDSKFYQILYRPDAFRNPTSAYPTAAATTDNHQVERLVGCSPDITRVPKSVYISYASESILSGAKSSVTKLAETLHKQGFKVHYKPFCEQELKRYGSLNNWKEYAIQSSESVIVVCTQAYYQEDSKWLSAEKGSQMSKMSVDSHLLRVLAFTPSEMSRVIPVLLDAKKTKSPLECVPMWLQSAQSHYWPSGKNGLLLSLDNKPKYVLPKVRTEDIIHVTPKVINFPKRRPRQPVK